ncbi:MAG: signal recognition particle protein [Gammaproteobacteria bacterium]
MFDRLTERLSDATRSLRGRGRLDEDNIADTLRQIRMALLEADVALPVVKTFVADVRERALGDEVGRSLTPGQALVKIVHDELVRVMGEASSPLDLRAQPPAVILLAGLQGSGKTTTAAKLARRLIERERKKVILVSADVYRPAAIQQLETLAAQIGAGFLPTAPDAKPQRIAIEALAEARRRLADVLIVDTAGRLHIDEAMMREIREIHAAANPVETLFVVDSMAGQDAVTSARAFDEALPLTGVILTKADGDARGGAALSVRTVTGKPIKFVGVGEKTDALEAFHPERMASRILGMGDVLSLVEEVQHKVDRKEADRLASRMRAGKAFDFNDLKAQLEQMNAMGGIGALLDKLPGMNVPQAARKQVDDREVRRQIAIIDSMTRAERRFPKTINGSRKRRIAAGSGTQVQDVNRLLKQFLGMQKMMKKVTKGGMAGLMRAMEAGRRPPGLR